MTRVIKDDKFIPVTLLKIPTLKVVGFKTLERDGYDAMIV
jgi:large subunit ribosomal protein L3